MGESIKSFLNVVLVLGALGIVARFGPNMAEVIAASFKGASILTRQLNLSDQPGQAPSGINYLA